MALTLYWIYCEHLLNRLWNTLRADILTISFLNITVISSDSLVGKLQTPRLPSGQAENPSSVLGLHLWVFSNQVQIIFNDYSACYIVRLYHICLTTTCLMTSDDAVYEGTRENRSREYERTTIEVDSGSIITTRSKTFFFIKIGNFTDCLYKY